VDPLRRTEHRPWPMPSRPWALRMTWRHLLFLHWPIEPALLRAALPEPLTLETFDGWGWLGVVPFLMSNVRLRGLPSVPAAREFPELNLRTYVTVNDRPGVYFFSLDATSTAAIEAARLSFGLNYLKAGMNCEPDTAGWVHYASHRIDRRGPPAKLAMRYRPTSEPIHTVLGDLDAFLTERYCLYAVDRRGRVRRGEIHHAPWPLQPAELEVDTLDMTRILDPSLPTPPFHARFAEHLDVLAWRARKVESRFA